jgi:hypothetical protein
MTRRQTGLLLALSWALLLPPWETNGSRAPLTRWQHAGSFDSAKECEAARAELIAAARRPPGDPWMVPDPDGPVPVEPKISWADSRCLPRDDPRIGPGD